MEAPDPLFVGIGIVASIVFFGLLYRRLRATDMTWFGLRALLIPTIGKVLAKRDDDLYVETETHEDEYVGTVGLSFKRLLEKFEDGGARVNLLASLASTEDGRTELASLVLLDGLHDMDQLHIRIYDAHPERTQFDGQDAFDIYAHLEPSAYHPRTTEAHYRGEAIQAKQGVEMARTKLERMGVNHETRPLDE